MESNSTPIYAQYSLSCPKCNADLGEHYSLELDKAREEGRQEAKRDAINLVAEGNFASGVQEEQTRIKSLIEEMTFKPELTAIHEEEKGWNDALEELIKRI